MTATLAASGSTAIKVGQTATAPSHALKMAKSMSEVELSDLIGEIYDAALEPALWAEILQKASAFVGGRAASIYSKDSVSKTANLTHNFGVDTGFRDSYLDTYIKMDPTTPGFFFFDVGEVVTTTDILPYDEFLDSRFYREWVKPQGWVDMVTSVLEKSTTSYAVFSVFRHEEDGLSDENARRRMRLLLPHVQRSILIGKTIQLNRAEAATLADTFDSLSAGLFLLDAKGRLVRANLSGHVLLSEGAILRAAGGRLIAINMAADDAIKAALARLEMGQSSLGAYGTAVPLTGSDGQHYVAYILPLTSGARRKAGTRYSAAAAMFVCKAQIEPPAAPEVIAKLYRLTPSELRVLLATFESGGVADVAEALGISEATTKTHLHRLFAKTGARRQADLVKLVAGFAGPGAKVDSPDSSRP
ncbi:MAG: helix-turn-helix transcriptional regulator [Afipia sp.]